MRKILITSGLSLVMCCLLFAACSKDDDTDVNTASVTGYYYIYFSNHPAEDGKYEGDIDSGSDQLLERMGHHSFAWTISGNKIKVMWSTTWTEEWQVKSLKGDEMTLQWKDEEVDYTIIAKFKKRSE